MFAEQFNPRSDQSSAAIRNAFICGLTVVIPHWLTPRVDVAAAPFIPPGNQLSNRPNVGSDTI